ncbi:uncharacterized protein LOC125004702 isoform X2 [Mugil cephalus]|uniref:uncharacterized protein LOC125004702 isoform X2 n=1 Tax=Mugil cephalus TaxID=48193 RepID=UPI001FB670E7|nr:uncharacterized protein LOC125004702 isoform X2 [Mugil cephalus]
MDSRPSSPAPSGVSVSSDWSKDEPEDFRNEPRPPSPAPSGVSMRSDRSKNEPENFRDGQSRPPSPAPSGVSMRSDWSKDEPEDFRKDPSCLDKLYRPSSPAPSGVSVSSDWSKDEPEDFRNEPRPPSPAPSGVSMRSDRSKNEPENFRDGQSRPPSPAPSGVSMRSDWSKDEPEDFRKDPRPPSPAPSGVSMRSDWSKDEPEDFRKEPRPPSPAPSGVSMRSDRSKNEPENFRDGQSRPPSPAPSGVSMRSDWSKDEPEDFRKDPRPPSPAPSGVSMRSDWSKDEPEDFRNEPRPPLPAPSGVSMRSDRSKNEPENFRDGQSRPPSPAPSGVSMRSDWSKDEPEDFRKDPRPPSPAPSGVSMRSDWSKDEPEDFRNEPRPPSPAPSGVSMRSDRSKNEPENFRDGQSRPPSPAPSGVSMRSDWSKDEPEDFRKDPRPPSPAPSGVSMRSDWSKDEPEDFRNEPRPPLPAPSGVSMRSDRSKNEPENFRDGQSRPPSPAPSGVSMRSDWSKDEPEDFRKDPSCLDKLYRPSSPAPSGVSVSSDWSKDEPEDFRNEPRPPSPAPSGVSMRSDRSTNEPENFRDGQSRPPSPAPSGVSMSSDWSKDEPEDFRNEPSPRQDKRPVTSEPIRCGPTTRDESEKVVRNFEQENPINWRQSGKMRILNLYEKELGHVEMDSVLYEVVKKKKLGQQQIYNNIFQSMDKTVRTVLTKGVAGVGKTFHSRMLMVDWAKGRSNQNIDLIVPLHFRELNERRDTSMEELLKDLSFLNDAQVKEICNLECKLAFVLDGLEEYKLPLDFKKNKKLTSTQEAASMDELLTNLIKGDLLPNADLWIISQPSGVGKIPPEHIKKVTECRESLKRREQLVSNLRQRFLRENAQVEDITHPNQRNTEHIMRENSDGNDGINEQNSVIQVNLSDIFKDEGGKHIRTVLTIGESSIGKSCEVQKFIKLWAENETNKRSLFTGDVDAADVAKDDLEVVFPFNLSELNLMNQESVSLVELLNHLFKETKESVISDYARFKVVFILDGLDAFEPPLDFNNSQKLTDEREPASVDVLLTNLIKGNLLPSAHVWIISRPPAAKKLPDDCVDRRTEIRENPITWRQFGKKRILDLYEKELGDVEMDSVLYEVVKKNKLGQKQKYSDIFQSKDKTVRTVLTKGVAGVGKTFHSRMFMVDWAKGKSNQNIDLIVPLHFRELNTKGNTSMEDLLKDLSFLDDAQLKGICNLQRKLAFVLDGLENCKLPLDFKNNKKLTDIKKTTSMDKLLTNLIKGHLLPNAHLWIISQPSGVEKIPPDHIKKVTECREYNIKQRLKENGKKSILAKYETELSQKEKDSEIYEISQNKKHEDKLIKTYDDMFQSDKRTVLTKGVAGVGKTFHSRMLMVDWAKGKSNQNIDLIVPLHFRELNTKGNTSMEDLLKDLSFLDDAQLKGICNLQCKLAFVLDGLENCKLPLDFKNKKKLTDIKKTTSMDKLLTNLIKGHLLPNAHLWIISQPSGVEKIPPEHIKKVTECRETLKRREQLVLNLRQRLLRENTEVEDIPHPNQRDTEHIMRGNSDGNDERNGQNLSKSVTEVNMSDSFKDEGGKRIRTVLTIGESGIGKSCEVRKFIKLWAENETNKRSLFTGVVDAAGVAKDDLVVVFPFKLSEVKSMRKERVSLVGLLNCFFKETKESVISDYARFKVVFVLDGLDAFEPPLDFDNCDKLTDEREPASVDVLLTNLIKGNLLPSAHVWIISQPSAAKQLPDACVDRRTEIREYDVKQRLKEDGKNSILVKYETELGQKEKDSEIYEISQNKKHGDKLVKTYDDMFESEKRTVLTKGVAGVGKTFHSRMLMVDWAEGKSNQNIDLIVPLHFRELNERRNTSMEELLKDLSFLNDAKLRRICNHECKVAFVLDGLEECKFPLDFKKNKKLSDTQEAASMDELLTNLIKGDLLPNAHLWIISQPSGVGKIPPEHIKKVTECRETLKRQEQLVSNLRQRFLRENTEVENIPHPKETKTEHIMRGNNDDNDERNGQNLSKSVKQVNLSEIFKDEGGKRIRTVLTIEESSVGKSCEVQKFIKMWAGNKTNNRSLFSWVVDTATSLFRSAKDDLEVIFPFNLSELNLMKQKHVSLVELLNHLFEETKESVISDYAQFKVVFILDGLDAFHPALDFNNSQKLTDERKPASVDVLLTNLIKGNLLPSARVWIISRASAAKQLPDACVDRRTEIKEYNIKQRLKEDGKKIILVKYEKELSQKEKDSEIYEIVQNKEHGDKLVQTYESMFQSKKRTVLTKGVAGVGKTFYSRMLMVDWAKGRSNQNIDLIVPLHFRELNERGNTSMEDLLTDLSFLNDAQVKGICNLECKVAFVLDGFEECKFPLDFENNKKLTDTQEGASMDELLTNLIKGDLLPNAHLWIISQPSGVGKIPPEHIKKVTECRETLKRWEQLVLNLRQRFLRENTEVEDIPHPNQRDTEHIMRENSGGNDEKNGQNLSKSVTEVNMSDIFKDEGGKRIRTVLTIGESGIGKSCEVRKFIKLWAENETNKHSLFTGVVDAAGVAKDDLVVVFPFKLSEVKSMRKERVSLVRLLNCFFKETKESVISDYARFKVVFILDGLDAFEPPLDFDNSQKLTDEREQASVDVLLTNLIKGNLLPSAHVWIISRPSAAKQLPDACVDKRTEIREYDVKQRLKEDGKNRILVKYETELGQKEKDSEIYEISQNKKHGDKLVKTYDDMFESEKRTVLTKGVAGVGKTFYSRMLMVDWAKGRSNQNIDLIVPLHFRELNERRDTSIEDLLKDLSFLNDAKLRRICNYECSLAFVLDGLEEYKLPLDFKKNKKLTSTQEAASIDELLTNLIKGDLLSNAHLWIISQPSGVGKIPPKYIKKVTECRESLKRREQLVSNLRQRLLRENTQAEDITHPKETKTEHIMRENSDGNDVRNGQKSAKSVTEVNVSEIFKDEGGKRIRTVLTIEESSIGKSCEVQKFIKMWAENETNNQSWFTWFKDKAKSVVGGAKDDFKVVVFPFNLSELKSRKQKSVSLVELLNHLFTETKESVISDYARFKVVFILDGLDAFHPPLDFNNIQKLTDEREPASVDVLLTNLIKGNLLPSARVWIISRASAAKQLPDDCVHKRTEIREYNIKQRLKEDGKKVILVKYEKELSQKEKDSEIYEIVQNKEHGDKLVQTYKSMFQSKKRTVLTKGVAGVGKTFHSRMLMVDWAKGSSNQNIDLIVPLHFRELNTRRDTVQSMQDLLKHILIDIRLSDVCNYECTLAFVLDGLEECKLPLDFENNKKLTDTQEAASMDELLTNLIKGHLLPNAHLWIISQPSGVGKIPPEHIKKVTECRESLKRREQLVSNLRQRFLRENTQVEDITHPNQTNTEHIMRENSDGNDGKNDQNSVTQVNVSDIFKDKRGKPENQKIQKIRTVLTTGESNIGKSFNGQKFIKMWAENKTNRRSLFTGVVDGARSETKDDLEVVFPFNLSELNLMKQKSISLVRLLNHLFKETKESVISDYARFKVVFVLDGLDAFEPPLDFNNSQKLTDEREPASVDVLLTNLIKGNLLPSARVWIISRPSAAKQLPDACVDKRTEIREYNIKQRLKEDGKNRILVKYETELSQKEKDSEIYEISQNKKHEDKLIKTYNDMFQSQKGTVLTKGVAGVGKTFFSRMLMVDWAKGRSNQNIDLIVPLHFRELSERRNTSMEELIKHILNDIRPSDACNCECTLVFVLDGLEECKFPLDFKKNKKLTSTQEAASMDELLTNLIKGDLLPNAHLWIISQPSGVGKIPPKYIKKVTECRETLKRREQLVSKLRQRLLRENTQAEDITHPKETNTEHIMTENSGGNDKRNGQNLSKSVTEVNVSEIFKDEGRKRIRTVLTIGESGIGKSCEVQKFIKMWAENKTNNHSWFTWFKDLVVGGDKDDLEVIFPFNLSELNLMKQESISLVELLNHLFEETKEYVISDYARFKVVFILDGLDAFHLPLDFNNCQKLTDEREPASADVLLTNLIKGNLLPSARVWIISPPSAAKQLPDACVDKRTEIRDYNIKQRLKEDGKKSILVKYEPKLGQKEKDSEIYEICQNKEHEDKLIKTYNDMFQSQKRTVLTKGVAGVGKTFYSMMLMVDWAKERSNQNIDLIVPLHFKELNERRNTSMEELIKHILNDIRPSDACNCECTLVFVLDGLEECKFPLDFKKNKKLTSTQEAASMDELLTNLIKGDLLPKAHLWIISQPSGVGKIPPKYIKKVTECRETLKRREQLVSKLRKRLLRENTQVEDITHPKETNTEHIMRGNNDDNDERNGQNLSKSVTEVNVSDIFKDEGGKRIRTVLTIEESDIGKSCEVQKFIKMWAEDKTNKCSLFTRVVDAAGVAKDDLEVLFPFKLSKLKSMNQKSVSLVELLNHLFTETKESVISDYARFKVVFILDGLDAFHPPLDFNNRQKLTDEREPASVDVLLKNLIKGNLLPSAHVWIISRPSAAKKLPDDCVDKRTEIREYNIKQRLKEDGKKSILVKYEPELGQKEKDSEIYEISQNKEHEDKLIKTYDDMFQSDKQTVLTKGVAGVGKTFNSMMLMVDWAKGRSNQNIDLIVPLHFKELNEIRNTSMEELIKHILSDIRPSDACNCECTLVFVLDGLEECKLPLNFKKNKKLTSTQEAASLDELLTNLIKGDLLPNAHLWIISQPSGVGKIPPKYIKKVTECRETLKRREQLVSKLRKRLLRENTQVEDITHPKETNTEHIMRGNNDDNDERNGQNLSKSVTEVNVSDIFKDEGGKRIRTVLTIEESNIGKSCEVQKFIKMWAENETNNQSWFTWFKEKAKSVVGGAKDDFKVVVFPFNLSELKSMNQKSVSLVELLNHLFTETKESVISDYARFKVVFILDGLDAFHPPLDFNNRQKLTDEREPASVDVLLKNLIKGNLLPSARVWIISRPSAAKQLPDACVHKRTEIREYNIKQRLKEDGKKSILVKYEPKLGQKEKDSEIYEICQNKEHEDKLIKTYDDMFQSEKRTVLTKGVAGVGKTFNSMMLMVDWAKGRYNQNIDLIVPLHFKELNERRNTSMEELIKHILNDIRPSDACNCECTLVFVLDGLEECKFPLDFENNKKLTGTQEAASMDELLTNLIKGDLLPNAHLWIISQPSGVGKIPPKYIKKVTECRESFKRREQLVSKLRKSLLRENTQAEDITHPNQRNTEHIMRENSDDNNERDEHNLEKLVKQVNVSEIFKDEGEKRIRTVLTIGESGIGKSFNVRKFIKMWAENETNNHSLFSEVVDAGGVAKDDLEVLFPFKLSKVKSMRKERVSLVQLLNYFCTEIKASVISDYARFKVVFILDGLDVFEPPLDFDNCAELTDEREPASVDVLLTNLIKGNLLPSACVWITSRPSAAKQLPDACVDKRTEIREKPYVASQSKLKSQLKEQFTCVSEGIDRQRTSALLKDIYTDLYIIEGERREIHNQHESRQAQKAKFKPMREERPIKYHDIFKPASENNPIRTVLTIGVAGIGKTFASMKFMLDWAEGTAVENIYYTFPLPFRELNLREKTEHSFEELLHQFFPAMENSEINDYDKYQILIVLDGLDECRLDLKFNESNKWTDVKKPTSVGVLLTNLIQGNLLPKAQIWITSQPAASNNIPADKVDRVTEVRGFNDEQKEEYFRKRFSDKDLAEKILAHVKKSRSLYTMCHIPVFCWIISKVLEDFVNQNKEEGMPKTQTDMYIHFLLLQCRQANVKYSEDGTGESSETGPCWSARNKETILSLGKLAFEELEKGNLLFTEDDLKECGIDITNAAVFSGLLTQIKREGRGLYQQKLFCFVHLSIQEFLAAFYAIHTFNNMGENVLTKPTSVVSDASDFYKKAVDKALDSKNGDWDLFLRFLLGLSVDTNQKLLQELLKKTENYQETYKETVEYIKKKINEDNSAPDKNLNLFHCLNELHDHSLVDEVKKYLQSETVTFESFSASQWSALTFVLLTSDEKLDVFDLKKYVKSEKVLLGLLPLVKVSITALLSWCELTEESCRGLTASVFNSPSSNLTKLDLSHNDLLDSGVEQLANGLKSLHCKLEILKLPGCQVTEKGCSFLAEALKSNTESHLKHLDLNYNHPGENGKMELSAIAEDPNMKLKTLCFDHDGAHRLKPGLKKYCANLKFEKRTTCNRLVLSEGNTKVKTIEKVEYKVERRENSDRFKRSQVFCDKGFKGFCYWEVECEGKVGIGVAYQGCNDMSLSLIYPKTEYTAIHGNISRDIKNDEKIAVFLDWEGGSLSYYRVLPGEFSLIHTFHEKFTDEVFPCFWFKKGSVTLCDIN